MIKAVIFDMYETLITLFDSPLYFGSHIAKDVGIPVDTFLLSWDSMEYHRSIGKITLEAAIETIMKQNHCYSKEHLDQVVEKRISSKRECFAHMNPGIVPMLTELKKRDIKVGLISNCFSEEAMVIRESILFPFFDAVCLSFEEEIQKPDVEIYRRCMKKLHVLPEECMYIGDGGSNELEAAEAAGIKAYQAVWYLKEGTTQPSKRKEGFIHLNTPSEVLGYLSL